MTKEQQNGDQSLSDENNENSEEEESENARDTNIIFFFGFDNH